MRFFPVFLNIADRKIVVTGGGECAVSKLRLLLKTQAIIHVFACEPEQQVLSWAQSGDIVLHRRQLHINDMDQAVMVYAAEDDPEHDRVTASLAKDAGVLFNIVDNLQDSQFITPAIVDRDPVTVAIGTEGTAPVLARKIKAEIEASLPIELGVLARIGAHFRLKAAKLPQGRARRMFWSRYFYEAGPSALKAGGRRGVGRLLNTLFLDVANQDKEPGSVHLVGAGPGDPDLLTRKALKVLHEADVVVHDRLVSKEILELARREAEIFQTGKQGYGPSWSQGDINALMIEHARKGASVVRLKSGDATVFSRIDEEMDALDAAGIHWDIVPGITTASAAAAALGVSLTKRNRNSAFRMITGHDIKGFAEQDWRDLAKDGSVAAVYMGMKAARFLSGRLLMFGADPLTPVTLMENVSRTDQRHERIVLGELADRSRDFGSGGPVIAMLGLEPREALKVGLIEAPSQTVSLEA